MAELKIVKQVPIPAEMIFTIFTSEQLKQWFGKEVRLEPEQLGEVYIDKGEHGIVSGSFLHFEPYSRIVFSWGWIDVPEHPPGTSIVEVTLSSFEKWTTVTLVHSNLPIHDVESHTRGWDEFMVKLSNVADALNVNSSALKVNP